MNRLAVDLYSALASAQHEPANLVFSPASISMTLAMAREGAAGTTSAQLDSLLGTGEGSELTRSVRALTTSVETGGLELAIVNSMFVQRGYELGIRFVDTLRSQYDTMPELVDYAADPENARTRINAWVDEATRHRIATLVPRGAVDGDTRLTLVNAIYMKARWQFPFAASATKAAEFTCADGVVRSVPTMRLVAGLAYAAGDGWRAVSLPYLPGSLSMLIVVPDSGRSLESAVTVAASATPTDWARVAVSLPRFDIGTAVSLVRPLRELGLRDAFDLATANFSGITTAEPMCIGDVVHQANITVDEAGTEAAAATALAMAGSGPAPEPPIEFRVDHPFAFAVRDANSSTPLFLGHIGNPT